MNKSSVKSEFQAGLFVLVGFFLLSLLILKFGDFKHWNRGKYKLVVQFEDAASLVKEAPVRRGGVEIGRISQDPFLEPGMSGVKVPLTIYSEYHISEGSEFHIKGDGLMGDSFVDVVPPMSPTGKMLMDGASVSGVTHGDLSSSANMVADNAKLVMQDLQVTLKDVRVALGKIVSDQNSAHLTGSLGNLETSLKKFDEGVLADKNIADLGVTLEQLRTTSERLSAAATNAEKLLSTADTAITTKMGPGLEEFTKAMASFKKTADTLGVTATDMRGSTGVLPALIKDPKLKEDFTALISNLRRNGLFFYKDDFSKLPAPGTAPKAPEKKGFFR